jgi:hypothetical protein
MSYRQATSNVEGFLLDCVTQTPLKLEFTASELAVYAGVDTPTASGWLQEYRTVASGVTPETALYTIGTWQRGRGSVWSIATWPTMTVAQRQLASGIYIAHCILSTLHEDIKPMLRNIVTEFIPGIRANRMNRTMIQPKISQLDGYFTMLTRYRSDIAGIRPVALRSVVRSLDAAVVTFINRINLMRNTLQTI